MRCFECGGEGHIANDCTFAIDTGPPWCGICDQQTHLVGAPGEQLKRCPECHPLRHQHLKHLRRCPNCRMLVHAWDTAPCGQHSSPAAKDQRPSIEHVREITGRTT